MTRQISDAHSRNSRQFSRSSNSSLRASPKATRRSARETEAQNGIDPDRFSLSECISPLADGPENPFSTFVTPARETEVPPKGEANRINSEMSDQPSQSLNPTDDNAFDADDQGAQTTCSTTPCDLRNVTAETRTESPASPDDRSTKPVDDVQRRFTPTRRHAGTTESVDPGVPHNLDDAYHPGGKSDDGHLTTRL